MKNDLNQEDISKLLKWKSKDAPSQDYLDDMQLSIARRLEASRQPSKIDNPVTRLIQKISDASFLNPVLKPAAAIGSLAVVALAVYVSFNNSDDNGLGISTSPASMTSGSNPIPENNGFSLGPNVQVMNASSGGDTRLSPRDQALQNNLTNQTNDPHFPFGESDSRPPTSRWPKK